MAANRASRRVMTPGGAGEPETARRERAPGKPEHPTGEQYVRIPIAGRAPPGVGETTVHGIKYTEWT